MKTNDATYTRWRRLARTSPSGKTQFVCLICGVVTAVPMKDCPVWKSGSMLVSCENTEARINTQIRVNEQLMPLLVSHRLSAPVCAECRGFGCACCQGSGEPHGVAAELVGVKRLKMEGA